MSDPLVVRGVVTPPEAGNSWRVRLQTESGTNRATREFEAATCAELADVTALFLAILIEPKSRVNRERQESEEAPPPVATERSEVSSKAMWSVGVVSGAARGILPSWAFGFGISGALSYRALRASLGVTLFTPVKKSLGADQGAEFWMFDVPVELCWQHSVGRFTPALCAGGRLARLRGEGFGDEVEGRARTIGIFSVSAGAALFFQYSKRGGLFLDADVVVPLDNRQFVFGGSDPALVFAPSAGASLLAGAQLSF
jgi:hypothetical protein